VLFFSKNNLFLLQELAALAQEHSVMLQEEIVLREK
jgi:hypothetical protein